MIKTIGELKKAITDLSDDMELFYPVTKVDKVNAHSGRYRGSCFSHDGIEYGCCQTAKASYPDSYPPVEMVYIGIKD